MPAFAPAPITVALIQMEVSGGEPDRNLARAEERVAEAARSGAHLVLLPEAMDVGWTHPEARQLAEPIPEGRACAQLARSAAEHRIFVCAGLTERAGPHTHNAAVLLDPHGRLLLLHRKLNELEIGHACYDPGDRVGVCSTELGTIGIMICADAFARGQIIGRTLGHMGADLILSPCAWAVPPDHDNERDPYGSLWRENYGPVAREYRLWILAASNVGPIRGGPWAGRQCIGCSMIVDPAGQTVLVGPYGPHAESILYHQIQPLPRPARGDSWEHFWNPTAPTPT